MQYLPEESTRSFSTAENKKRRMKRQQLNLTDFTKFATFHGRKICKYAAVNANIFMDFKVKSQFCNCLSFLLSFSNVTCLT
jgi:hypothetical protein